jgi:hypothetical protein
MVNKGSAGNAERSGYQGLFHEKKNLMPRPTKTGIAAKRKKKLAKPGRDEVLLIRRRRHPKALR